MNFFKTIFEVILTTITYHKKKTKITLYSQQIRIILHKNNKIHIHLIRNSSINPKYCITLLHKLSDSIFLFYVICKYIFLCCTD